MKALAQPLLVALAALVLVVALPASAQAQCADADLDGHEDAGCGGDDCDDLDPLAYPGAAELCDGADNDCDTVIDQTWPELGQACDGADVDLCTNGAWACLADQTGVECLEEGSGLTELCNTLDDDCDGATDEDWLDLGQVCDGPDPDQCATGSVVCAPGGQATECQETVSADDEELCNALDDDCDGQTDEDFGDFVCGLGECQTRVAACLDGVPQTCSPAAAPEPDRELSCEDGLDNDCDGASDDEDVADCGEGGSGCSLAPGRSSSGAAFALLSALLVGLALVALRRRA
ncbi:MAG TPA: MopE-related protein [Myxococcota bacterium]|nr:MopE-related protein [Myxococcota bacterium]HRY95186.1 MopE-related protein [Myxococcota bacterium]HSA20411.1 MopE-related protein [Myxococcota bacterium]